KSSFFNAESANPMRHSGSDFNRKRLKGTGTYIRITRMEHTRPRPVYNAWSGTRMLTARVYFVPRRNTVHCPNERKHSSVRSNPTTGGQSGSEDMSTWSKEVEALSPCWVIIVFRLLS